MLLTDLDVFAACRYLYWSLSQLSVLSEKFDPQKTQRSQQRAREKLYLEKSRSTSLLLNLFLPNIKMDNLPLVNLDSLILANLCKVTLSRVTFPKVNLSRAIRQATNQVPCKDIQPS